MKKQLRKIAAVVLVLVIALGTAAIALAGTDSNVITNVNDVYDYAHSTELVNIYQATLKAKDGTKTPVYYVVCRGLDFTSTDINQPRNLINAIKIGLSDEDNAYVKAVVKAVTETCEPGSNLIFAGHSMGGMVIEQAIANDTLKDNYNILYALAIGSPYIITSGEKEGRLIRAVDNLDPVPFLSIPLLANPFMGETSTETSFKFGLVHFKSYDEGSCWDKYDALGIYKGKGKTGNQIILNQILYSVDVDGNSKL